MTSDISTKTIGRILEILGISIVVIAAVLRRMPNNDLGTIGVLLVAGACLFLTGLILSHLPKNRKNRREKNEKRRKVEAAGDVSRTLPLFCP